VLAAITRKPAAARAASFAAGAMFSTVDVLARIAGVNDHAGTRSHLALRILTAGKVDGRVALLATLCEASPKPGGGPVKRLDREFIFQTVRLLKVQHGPATVVRPAHVLVLAATRRRNAALSNSIE
jgi:hypothetical protein